MRRRQLVLCLLLLSCLWRWTALTPGGTFYTFCSPSGVPGVPGTTEQQKGRETALAPSHVTVTPKPRDEAKTVRPPGGKNRVPSWWQRLSSQLGSFWALFLKVCLDVWISMFISALFSFRKNLIKLIYSRIPTAHICHLHLQVLTGHPGKKSVGLLQANPFPSAPP